MKGDMGHAFKWIGGIVLGFLILAWLFGRSPEPAAIVSPTVAPTVTAPVVSAPQATSAPATAVPMAAPPTDVPTVAATPTPGVPWNEALSEHMQLTVCSPTEDPEYPRPDWCDKFKAIVLSGDHLIVRAAVTDREEAEAMGRGLVSFAYNNLYQGYGIKRITIFSDDEGGALYEREW